MCALPVFRTLSSLTEQDYFTFLYRHCSVDLGYLQSYCKDGIISSADADSLREGVITDCTKAITELLQAINGLKGTLSIPSASQKPSDDKIEGADSGYSLTGYVPSLISYNLFCEILI